MMKLSGSAEKQTEAPATVPRHTGADPKRFVSSTEYGGPATGTKRSYNFEEILCNSRLRKGAMTTKEPETLVMYESSTNVDCQQFFFFFFLFSITSHGGKNKNKSHVDHHSRKCVHLCVRSPSSIRDMAVDHPISEDVFAEQLVGKEHQQRGDGFKQDAVGDVTAGAQGVGVDIKGAASIDGLLPSERHLCCCCGNAGSYIGAYDRDGSVKTPPRGGCMFSPVLE